MCVIFLAIDQHPDHRLLLLANRDEFYDRPTAPAQNWEDFPSIYGGRDLIGGGTWLGVTNKGRFAALTNYRDPKAKKGTTSRGVLVADFLKTDNPAKAYLRQVREKANDFSGFNLLVGEVNDHKSEIIYFSNRSDSIVEIGRGLFGLGNRLLDTPWPKVVKGKARFAESLEQPSLDREDLFQILADKTLAADEELPDTGIGYEREKAISSIFIETPVYGTRSSTIVSISKDMNIDFDERVFV